MATRKNYCLNPTATNNTTGWGGGSTPTRSTGLTGMPRTTGLHYSANGYAQSPAISGVGAGEQWTLSLYFQNNTGFSLGTKAFYFVCVRPSGNGGDDFSQFTNFALPVGTTRLSVSKTTLANTTGLYVVVDSFNATSGSGVEISSCMFEKVPALDTYFDGDSANAVWDGTAGNSSSTYTDPPSVRPGAFIPFL